MRIAIIEDHIDDQRRIREMILRFFRENLPDKTVEIETFDDAVRFLDPYRSVYDIVFMDIQMPMMDGMQAAQRLRKLDENVPLVFITNMAQYAVKGYDVNALGFVLKPVQYEDFYLSMRRAVQRAKAQDGRTITVSGKQGVQRLLTTDLLYVEVDRHTLLFHTRQGIFGASGSMGDIQKKLGDDFLLCNRSFLINPRAIKTISGYDVIMENGETVPISRPRKKEFLAAFNHWLGEGNEL